MEKQQTQGDAERDRAAGLLALHRDRLFQDLDNPSDCCIET